MGVLKHVEILDNLGSFKQDVESHDNLWSFKTRSRKS